MADQKLTELTELTSASGDDLTYIVDDPGGSPLSRKITIANLIAGGWIVADAMTYSSADDPTYVMTCSGDKTATYYAGQRIKLSQSTGGTKYFIVTKVAYNNPNTEITMYGGTDYNLENEAITSPFYSIAKAPSGFPLDPTKWTVTTTDTGNRSQATPSSTTWYNPNNIAISIPIGCWHVNYQVAIVCTDTDGQYMAVSSTLSTANNSESDADFTNTAELDTNATTKNLSGAVTSVSRNKYLTLTTKTSYYLNVETWASGIETIGFRGDLSKTIIRAVCAYL